MLSILPGIWMYRGLMSYFSYFKWVTYIPDFPLLFGRSMQFPSTSHMRRLGYRAPIWLLKGTEESRGWNAGWDQEDSNSLSCSQTTRSPVQRALTVFICTSMVLPLTVFTARSVFPLSLSMPSSPSVLCAFLLERSKSEISKTQESFSSF